MTDWAAIDHVRTWDRFRRVVLNRHLAGGTLPRHLQDRNLQATAAPWRITNEIIERAYQKRAPTASVQGRDCSRANRNRFLTTPAPSAVREAGRPMSRPSSIRAHCASRTRAHLLAPGQRIPRHRRHLLELPSPLDLRMDGSMKHLTNSGREFVWHTGFCKEGGESVVFGAHAS